MRCREYPFTGKYFVSLWDIYSVPLKFSLDLDFFFSDKSFFSRNLSVTEL